WGTPHRQSESFCYDRNRTVTCSFRIRMAFGPYEEGELFAVPDRPTEPSRRWRQRGAVALRCGEKSSHQKTGLEVGSVKSAVADPADVLAAYVSKMWSQARNSLALDGLEWDCFVWLTNLDYGKASPLLRSSLEHAGIVVMIRIDQRCQPTTGRGGAGHERRSTPSPKAASGTATRYQPCSFSSQTSSPPREPDRLS